MWIAFVTQTQERGTRSLFTSGAISILLSPFPHGATLSMWAIKVTRPSVFRKPSTHYKPTTVTIPCSPLLHNIDYFNLFTTTVYKLILRHIRMYTFSYYCGVTFVFVTYMDHQIFRMMLSELIILRISYFEQCSLLRRLLPAKLIIDIN